MGPKMHPGRRGSIAVRTASGVVAVVFVVLGALSFGTYTVASHTVDAQLDESVRQAWQRASMAVSGPGTRPPGARDPGMLNGELPEGGPLSAPGLQADTVIALFSADGTPSLTGIVAASDSQATLTDDDEAIIAGLLDRQSGPSVVRARLSGGDYAFEISPMPEPGGASRGATLIVGLPSDPYEQTNRNLLLVLSVGGLAALLVVGAGVWWWVRRSMGPLERVAAAASAVSAVPMHTGIVNLDDYRLPSDLEFSPDEVGDVASALNQLFSSVDEAFRSRVESEDRLRQFVADASHELRTPLAGVRGYADMIRLTEPLSENASNMLERILSQSERMSELVESLLLLARLDARDSAEAETQISSVGGITRATNTERQSRDFGELVVEASTDAAVMSPSHKWTTIVPEDPVYVRVPRPQLMHAITNLLSNARKHTPPGTRVTVELTTRTLRIAENPSTGTNGRGAESGRVGKFAILTVSDDGPGILPDLIGQVFDRFVTADPARSFSEGSSGLGLSIVRSVARSAGGEASVSSQDGTTVFQLALPLADS